MCVSIGFNIHVSIHMDMIIGMPRSINVHIRISVSINISISSNIMHIRISLTKSANFHTKTGI